jgi:DNA-binding transcriptional LysR family regulator
MVCETTSNLLKRIAENSVDLALITHGHGDNGGVVVHEEPVVWVTSALHCVHEQQPLPLALFQPGCIFRKWALRALAEQGRASRVAYTSMSVNGIEAALRAGLAVSALARSNVKEGLRILDERDGFPPLPTYQLALRRATGRSSVILDRLEEHIIASFQSVLPFTAVA